MLRNTMLCLAAHVLSLAVASASPAGSDLPASGAAGKRNEDLAARQAFEARAVERVAERRGLVLSELQVVHSATASFPTIGETAFCYKVSDARGRIAEVCLREDGQETDGALLEARERVAHEARFGKLHPALSEKLERAGRDERIEVAIWLKEPTGNLPGPRRPDPDSVPWSEPEADAAREELETSRRRAIDAAVTPLVESLALEGSESQPSDIAPIVHAKLLPSQIRALSKRNEVLEISEPVAMAATMVTQRATVLTDVVNKTRNLNGSGRKVAQIEVGGLPPYNPYRCGMTIDSTNACANNHALWVAGIICGQHSSYRGHAKDVAFWSGGSCQGVSLQVQGAASRALNWGAQVLNLSLGSVANVGMDGNARFFDGIVRNNLRTVVATAGNNGGNGDWITSPGTGYNVITVGASNDADTSLWPDDSMGSFSSFVDPVSTRNDREKPEVVAPGTSISGLVPSFPYTGSIGSGTSFAAPVVSSEAALLIERNSTLSFWPQAVKAIVMATAVENVEGAARLSDKDGAGSVVLSRADDVARKVGGNWGARTYRCADTSLLNLANVGLSKGMRLRAVLAWDTDPNYVNYATQPSADLDLQLIGPDGTVRTASASYDNTYEIVDFTASTAGTYTIRMARVRCSSDPGTLGWAFHFVN